MNNMTVADINLVSRSRLWFISILLVFPSSHYEVSLMVKIHI